MYGNAERIKINHHRADEVSVLKSSGKRAELAFFHNGTWVNMGEPWLQGYWDGTFDCPVYHGIPNWIVDAFLDIYRA